MSKVKESFNQLLLLHQSMNVALTKAAKGSTVEDGYFLEKLKKTANILGYELKKRK